MRVRDLGALLRDVVASWNAHGGTRLGAALAYYAFFSLAPLIVILTAVVSIVLGAPAPRAAVFAELHRLMGPAAAAAVERTASRARWPAGGGVAAGVGVLVLLSGASAMVGEMRVSLDRVWGAKAPAGLWVGLRKRLVSMAMVLGLGFVLLVSLILNAAVAAAGAWLGRLTGVGPEAVGLANELASLATVTLLFAGLYKILPDAPVAWRDAWTGALVTGVAFTEGKHLIGLYLGRAASSPYGAAGSLALVLLWIYYCAQILYLGAEFTRAWGERHGRGTAALAARRIHPVRLGERRGGGDRRLSLRR